MNNFDFLEKCPPMRSAASLNITCIFNCENVDCLKPAVPGTRLKPKCKYLHSFPNGLKEPEIELHCLPNGRWDGQLYECVPSNTFIIFPNINVGIAI